MFCRNSLLGKSIFNVGCRYVRIYTRTGDKGTSSLFNGERRPKDDQRFHTLGAIDELNASIGFSREFCIEAKDDKLADRLSKIQFYLFDIGAHVATPPKATEEQIAKTTFDASLADELEKWIDEYDATLPPLKNFILPSGGKSSSSLHLARTVCRRAEREIVSLVRDKQVNESVGKYVNRLSDFLFIAARHSASRDKVAELLYTKNK